MSGARFAIIDPAAGISGDMLLGALIGAGADVEWLRGVPGRLGFPGVTIDVHPVDRCGLRAVKVDVRLPGGEMEHPSPAHEGHEREHDHDHHGDHHHGHDDDHDHHHDHGHAHPHHHAHGDGAHRHIGDLIAIVGAAPLSEWVRERAVRAFRLLGEAEGRVHGMAAEDVPLHEVGAVDALVDIVAGIEGFERLGIERIHSRPVATGRGWVRAAHGVMSVPTPATATLLHGLEIGPDGPVEGEATTPTGAVLLRVLSSGAPPARWRAVSAEAWGAGGRNPRAYANALRMMIAEPVAEAGEVVMLVTDIDDLSPEYLEPLREALAAAGAVDVQSWPTQMKKGRVGFRVEALAPPAAAEAVAQAFFRHSTTAGIRRWTAERTTLPRHEVSVRADDGTAARVKVVDAPGGPRAKPEYDDVAAIARRTGRAAHEVARELQATALRLIGAPTGAPPSRQTEEP